MKLWVAIVKFGDVTPGVLEVIKPLNGVGGVECVHESDVAAVARANVGYVAVLTSDVSSAIEAAYHGFRVLTVDGGKLVSYFVRGNDGGGVSTGFRVVGPVG
jgi:hypothetical protein